jgi:type I restriction enzyme, R subunit
MVSQTNEQALSRLNEDETELDPQNPNPRGAHGGDEAHDPLDDIVRRFNERWFQGWSATPEEQRIKFIHIADNTNPCKRECILSQWKI